MIVLSLFPWRIQFFLRVDLYLAVISLFNSHACDITRIVGWLRQCILRAAEADIAVFFECIALGTPTYHQGYWAHGTPCTTAHHAQALNGLEIFQGCIAALRARKRVLFWGA